MRGAWTIATREFRSFFRLPVGWVVIALYLLLCGVVFAARALIPGQPASLRGVFGLSGWLLLPVGPAISMRLFSEELRSGTIEPLMTAPVSDAAVVIGKFAGAVMFLVTMLLPTLAYVGALYALADPRPDWGPIAAGYLVLVLLGMLYLAVGTLASTLTSNQTLAFLGTFIAITAMLLVSGPMAEQLPAWARGAALAVAIGPRLDDFAKGVIDTGHVVFFLCASAWFLVLAVVALQSRRWR